VARTGRGTIDGVTAPTDAALLADWAAGDRVAGRALFDRYFPRLRRFFANKAEADADDLIQSTLLACIEARSRMRASFPAFLFAVARNILHDYYRRKSGRAGAIDPDQVAIEELGASPSGALAGKREHRVLLEALRRIPLDHQITLELHYWERLSTTDLAEILEVPPSTLKSRLQRARELLKQRIDELQASGERLETTMDDVDAWARRVRDAFAADDREG
jgi:RNA polymerase sigma-70 factor (ECF subfamily)